MFHTLKLYSVFRCIKNIPIFRIDFSLNHHGFKITSKKKKKKVIS